MLLFVYNSRLRTRESFDSLRLKKQTQASPFVAIFSRQWKKMINRFLWHQYKPLKANKQLNDSIFLNTVLVVDLLDTHPPFLGFRCFNNDEIERATVLHFLQAWGQHILNRNEAKQCIYTWHIIEVSNSTKRHADGCGNHADLRRPV